MVGARDQRRHFTRLYIDNEQPITCRTGRATHNTPSIWRPAWKAIVPQTVCEHFHTGTIAAHNRDVTYRRSLTGLKKVPKRKGYSVSLRRPGWAKRALLGILEQNRALRSIGIHCQNTVVEHSCSLTVAEQATSHG